MIGQTESPTTSPQKLPNADSEAIYLVDRRGRILFTTPIGASFYGFEPDDLIGQPVLNFVAPESLSSVRSDWRNLVNEPAQTAGEMTIKIVDANHVVRAIRATLWRVPGHDLFIVIHHFLDDVRDRLQTLYAVLATLTGTLDLDAVIKIVMEEVHRLIIADRMTLFVTDEPGTLRLAGTLGKPLSAYSDQVIRDAASFDTIKLLYESKTALIINDCHHDPRWIPAEGSNDIQSWIGAPLIHHGEIVGVLNLDSTRTNAFTAEDAALAQALATQVAAAVHNARRYHTEQRRAERYAALNDISLAISHLDLNSVLEVVYHKISVLMDTSSFYVALYDAEANLVRLTGAYEHDVKVPDSVQSADVGLIGRILRQRESLVLLNTQNSALPENTIVDGETPLSLVMIPLFVQETLLGLYSVQSYRAYAFSSDDVAMLEAIAGTLATAIKNAQLYDETAEQLVALTTMHRLGLGLAEVQDPQGVVQLMRTL